VRKGLLPATVLLPVTCCVERWRKHFRQQLPSSPHSMSLAVEWAPGSGRMCSGCLLAVFGLYLQLCGGQPSSR
jgi:hypothetical protein